MSYETTDEGDFIPLDQMPLTGEPAKRRIVELIIEYKREHGGNSPDYRWLRDNVPVSSTSMVRYYIEDLVRRGKLIQTSGKSIASRSLDVPTGMWITQDEFDRAIERAYKLGAAEALAGVQ